MTPLYRSSRGGSLDQDLTFTDAVMRGLALDGGLFVPTFIPTVAREEWVEWSKLANFWELAAAVMSKFISTDEMDRATLEEMLKSTYSTPSFRDAGITPVRKFDGAGPDGEAPLYLLELFHGPTFAFKDVALQFLGRVFAHILKGERASAASGESSSASGSSSSGRMTVVAATSGDTGSSAIHGLGGQPGVECFVLFPKGGPSEIQQQQMTTVADENVHCIAVEGDFDDCQRIVKSFFNTPALRETCRLGAVNSINWARILAQIVYYWWSYFRVLEMEGTPAAAAAAAEDGAAPRTVSFSVPTGNFGDILAGYYAKRMGLPVDRLVVATNSNDILDRFFRGGAYAYTGASTPTPAPSMDISVSSNFERFLYHCFGDDSDATQAVMKEFAASRTIAAPAGSDVHANAVAAMDSGCATDVDIFNTIASFKQRFGYTLDPHTAVGVCVATGATLKATRESPKGVANDIQQKLGASTSPVVCLACAHWAKFPAVQSQAEANGVEGETLAALSQEGLVVPSVLAALASLPQRCVVKSSEFADVRAYILETLLERELIDADAALAAQ